MYFLVKYSFLSLEKKKKGKKEQNKTKLSGYATERKQLLNTTPTI